MTDLLPYLKMYTLLTVVSFAISVLFYLGNRRELEFKLNMIYWLCMLALIATQAVFSENPPEIVFAFSLTGSLILTLAYLLSKLYKIELPIRRKYFPVLLIGIAFSGLLMFCTDEFTYFAIPVAFSMSGTVLHYTRRIYINSNCITKSGKFFLWFVALWAMHLADFPWLRMYQEAVIPAFYIAFLFGFFMSIFIPYLIAESTRKRYTQNLEEEISTKTENLRNVNNALEKVAEHRSTLIKLLCHDTYNNLTIIKMAQLKISNMAEKITENIEQKKFDIIKFAGITDSTVNRQVDLIRSATELISINDAKAKVQVVALFLPDLIKESISLIEKKVLDKNITLILRNYISKGNIFANRPLLVHSVFLNVLTNAVKFTSKGGKISLRSGMTSNGVQYLVVKDSGVGIPNEILASLFESSVSHSRLGTSGEIGTGFGMTIMKTIADKMNIHVQVRSRDKKKFPHNHMTLFLFRFYSVEDKLQRDVAA